MRSRPRTRAVLLSILSFTVVLLVTTIPRAQGQPPTFTVDMRDFAFEPRDLMVPAGSTVRWVNRDESPHSVAMLGGRPGSSRGSIRPGGEHAVTFQAGGRFAYRCGVHPTMLGEIIVAGQ